MTAQEYYEQGNACRRQAALYRFNKKAYEEDPSFNLK